VPRLGSVRLCDLRPKAAQDLFNAWQDAGYSDATMSLARTVLSSALKQAVTWGYIRENPVTHIKCPASRTPKREGRSFTSAEAVAFIGAASRRVEDAPYVFNLVTGLRPEEIAGLRKIDVELARTPGGEPGTWAERGLVRVR
jgi:integrase